MIQLYFLSIALNGLTGFLFVFYNFREDHSIEDSMKFSPLSGGFRLVLGILTAVTGILKFLLPLGNRFFILGDLIPALSGIAAGFTLIFGFYREHSSQASNGEGKLDRLGDFFLHYHKMAGIVLLAAALLHFLFPSALLL